MLKLNLRNIAKELDTAIEVSNDALQMLNNSEEMSISKGEREQLKVLSKKCMQLEALRDETDLMVFERIIHQYGRQQAIDEIEIILSNLKEAREFINV